MRRTRETDETSFVGVGRSFRYVKTVWYVKNIRQTFAIVIIFFCRLIIVVVAVVVIIELTVLTSLIITRRLVKHRVLRNMKLDCNETI